MDIKKCGRYRVRALKKAVGIGYTQSKLSPILTKSVDNFWVFGRYRVQVKNIRL